MNVAGFNRIFLTYMMVVPTTEITISFGTYKIKNNNKKLKMWF